MNEYYRGVSGGWAIAHPDFVRLEDAAGQGQRAALGAFHKLRLHLGWVGGQKNV